MERRTKIALVLAAAAILGIIVAVDQPRADRVPRNPDKADNVLQNQNSPAQYFATRYGDKVAARVIKSAEARGWKQSDQVFVFGKPRPTRASVRTVQDVDYGDGGGWIRVWEWEDGDDLNTVEGTVEIGRHSSGQSVVFNIQLHTPDGENTQAETTWSEVIYHNPGTSPASIPLIRPNVARSPSIVPVQSTWCRAGQNKGDQLVVDCQARNAARYFRASWRNAWMYGAGAAAVICRRGGVRARLACAAEAVGAVLAGELIKNFNDPPDGMENCDRERLILEWCLLHDADCTRSTRAGCGG